MEGGQFAFVANKINSIKFVYIYIYKLKYIWLYHFGGIAYHDFNIDAINFKLKKMDIEQLNYNIEICGKMLNILKW